MKQIQLTQRKVALVDDADYEWLNQWKWSAQHSANNWYVIRTIWKNGKATTIRMHRLIMGLKLGDKKQIDHIDGNGLNNQRDNLRFCSHCQNLQNSEKHYDEDTHTSPYKGVSWSENNFGMWTAHIRVNKKQLFLGYFYDELDAAAVYDYAALKYFGEFALTNFEMVLAA